MRGAVLANQKLARNEDVCRVLSPEVEALPTTRGLRHPKRVFDSANGIRPWRANPKDVAGMKQGRQVAGG
jgi:hypothetical protein